MEVQTTKTNPFKDCKEALRQHFVWQRLFAEEEGVISCNSLSRRRNGFAHRPANCLRLFTAVVLSPIYLLASSEIPGSIVGYLLPNWVLERAHAPKAFLKSPDRSRVGDDFYNPGQASPRWILEVSYAKDQAGQPQRNVRLVSWKDDLKKKYIALSYSFDNAKVLFHEAYPSVPLNSIPPEPFSPTDPGIIIDDPLLTAWKERSENPKERERWREIAIRQRVARVFLDRYLDISNTPDKTEYIWLDEFCLYNAASPSLKDRTDELGHMADIFSQASAVCVFCPQENCNHTSDRCDWGKRLWTLSEIVHTDRVITMTGRTGKSGRPGKYTLTEHQGRNFRDAMQRSAERDQHWHLSAIMRHANNGGSTTWQHSIHSLVIEAIKRNKAGGHENGHLGKALNGLLPRRARPEDLTGKDGWADLAWLLEINQGFYNAASLAAVCGLGESKVQGHGWLGPPIQPAAGNERIQPLATAFPTNEGLLILGPKIIGLGQELERDPGGMYRNKDLRLYAVTAISLPFVALAWSILILTIGPMLGIKSMESMALTFVVDWILLSISAIMQLIGTLLYVKKGVYLLTPKTLDGQSPDEYMESKDRQLTSLELWGADQLAPQWKVPNVASEEASVVDLISRVRSPFHMRKWEGKEPNALIPIAVHGCGVTCLVVHHEDSSTAAVKLGIVNMPPYILALGTTVGSLVVGAVPEVTREKEPSKLDQYLTAAAGRIYPSQLGHRQGYPSDTTLQESSPYGSRVGLTQTPTSGAYPPTPKSEQDYYPRTPPVERTQPVGSGYPRTPPAERTQPMGGGYTRTPPSERTQPVGGGYPRTFPTERTQPVGGGYTPPVEWTQPVGNGYTRAPPAERTQPMGGGGYPSNHRAGYGGPSAPRRV